MNLTQLIRETLPLLQERMKAGEDAKNAVETVEQAVEDVKETVGEINQSVVVVANSVNEVVESVNETAKTVGVLEDQITELLPMFARSLRFRSESERVTLIGFDAKFFEPFVFTQNREYDHGEVSVMGSNKWLNNAQGTRLNNNETPESSPRFWLHRDNKSFDIDGEKRHWVREELCLQGFWRWDEKSPQPERRGWYRVKTRLVASATDAFNDSTNWEYMGTDNPPE